MEQKGGVPSSLQGQHWKTAQPFMLTFTPKDNYPVQLSSKSMCKDCGRKLEDLDRTHTDKEPGTSFLLGDHTNHCTAVPPDISEPSSDI